MAVDGSATEESVILGLRRLSDSSQHRRERTSFLLLGAATWYRLTVEGRLAPEHDTLPISPAEATAGLLRPGRREGVEGEIRRD